MTTAAERARNVKVFVDEIKNGARGRTMPESSYFRAAGSKPGVAYGVTINFLSGHWCDCRGHLSKMGAHKRRGEKQNVENREHWCKHVHAVLANPVLLADGIKNRRLTLKGE